MAVPQTVTQQVAGISVFAIAQITPLTSGESVTPGVTGFLPGLEGQRRIACSFTIIDTNQAQHVVSVVIDYRDELFEQRPIAAPQVVTPGQQGGV